jgi:hypothetical protein
LGHIADKIEKLGRLFGIPFLKSLDTGQAGWLFLSYENDYRNR